MLGGERRRIKASSIHVSSNKMSRQLEKLEKMGTENGGDPSCNMSEIFISRSKSWNTHLLFFWGIVISLLALSVIHELVNDIKELTNGINS